MSARASRSHNQEAIDVTIVGMLADVKEIIPMCSLGLLREVIGGVPISKGNNEPTYYKLKIEAFSLSSEVGVNKNWSFAWKLAAEFELILYNNSIFTLQSRLRRSEKRAQEEMDKYAVATFKNMIFFQNVKGRAGEGQTRQQQLHLQLLEPISSIGNLG
ncbi:hypothetical protein Tco_0838602 [Tanacetum coccineum]|uniref:Uncharacterized protein n=1 Tax=Tanacetum coccineum TaxID=301880 RepID=A0ABQ5AN94_9ASTR